MQAIFEIRLSPLMPNAQKMDSTPGCLAELVFLYSVPSMKIFHALFAKTILYESVVTRATASKAVRIRPARIRECQLCSAELESSFWRGSIGDALTPTWRIGSPARCDDLGMVTGCPPPY
jgi:hypothetical protein